MPETQSRSRAIRFGPFEADLRTGELRKDSVKLKFSGRPFQVLAILLERPGEVVTREELQKRLWPDTFVDVERNLNTAVNKIREVLGDSAESPRFVETLPRRGYRFIGELEMPVQPVAPETAVEPQRRPRQSQLRWKIGAAVIAIAVIALVALFAYRWRRQPTPEEQAVLNSVPFTALPGRALEPAFSPDGSRIAFMWSAAPQKEDFDLYVKLLGSETLLRLTQHPSEFVSPAWSPDGTRIAFHRRAADSGIFVVPALGGPEQKLRSTRHLADSISWSPDGRLIAFEDVPPNEEHFQIYLLSMETLEASPIPFNPSCVNEGEPAFSHNGKYLAYWCYSKNGLEAALFIYSLPDGKPTMIVPFLNVPLGVAWSADDTKLIYSMRKGNNSAELAEISIENGSPKRLGLEGMWPAVSPRGDKLAYASLTLPLELWRRDLLHPETPPVKLLPSSRSQYDAQYSPDGKRIAFASLRSGVQAVWMSNADGSNLVLISDPAHMSGSPQWSPDGNKIVFDSNPQGHWELYIADMTEGKPRKLVTNISSIFRPSWSRDGKWIYFVSGQPGRQGVYRCPASGGDAIQLSKDRYGLNPQESYDGNTVYFVSGDYGAPLKKLSLGGKPGSESVVDGSLRLLSSQLWQLAPGGIYFVPRDAPKSVRYFDFATRQTRTIFEVDIGFGGGLSASPNGHWILCAEAGEPTGDIMLVDHFR
jgi:Tol biopolymer transport system component/DNA-binding winged helix-turn-helix (wHTH) protein